MICQNRNMTEGQIGSVVYEIGMSLLAIIAVAGSIADFSENLYIEVLNDVILLIFALDYGMRFHAASNKMEFVKENILDLISIIPFSSIFRVFRLTKIFRLARLTKLIKFLRLFTFSKKFHKGIKRFLNTNGFIYVLYITISIIAFGSVSIYLVEKGKLIQNFEDAIWLSFCSTTLFGYEGMENMTLAGKLIVAVLSLIGICFTGIFTATVVAFMNRRSDNQDNENKVIDLSDLNDSEFGEVENYVQYIRNKDNIRFFQ